MAIIEACRNYSLQKAEVNRDFIDKYAQDNETVIPGQEEALVEEILNRLKKENIKCRENVVLHIEFVPEEYIKDKYDKYVQDVNSDKNESVTIFNKLSFDFASRLLSLNEEKQTQFLQTFYHYRKKSSEYLDPEVKNILRSSIDLLSDKTKNWFKAEIDKLNVQPDKYIKYVMNKINSEHSTSKYNSSKLFIMVYLINKLELL